MSKEIKPKLMMIDASLPIEDLEFINSNTFAVAGIASDVDNTTLDRLSDIIKTLKSKGFKFNYNNDIKDALGKYVFSKYTLFTDVYLPFKNFNKESLIVDDEEVTPVVVDPSVKAHKIAARVKFKKEKDDEGNLRYNLLNEYIKKFSARDVHLLLGANCAYKVKFMLIYTEDDVESTEDKIDYKTTGAAAFPVRVASELGIPVFNLHKAGRIDDLKEFVDNL